MPEVPPDPTGWIDDADQLLGGCFWVALVVGLLLVALMLAWMEWMAGCGPGGCL